MQVRKKLLAAGIGIGIGIDVWREKKGGGETVVGKMIRNGKKALKVFGASLPGREKLGFRAT